MKKILLSALVAGALSVGTAHAQDPAGGKTLFAISAGASLPVGMYGSTDPMDFETNIDEISSFDEKVETRSVGGAKMGINIDMTIGHYFMDYIGAGVKLGIMYNAIDRQDGLYEAFAITRAVDDNKVYQLGEIREMSPEAWIHTTAMPMLFFDYPAIDNFNITAEAGAGLAFTLMPELREEKASGLVSSTHGAEPTAGFAYTFGLGFRYAISEKAGIKLAGNYLAFESGYTEFDGRNTNALEKEYSLPVSVINLNFGFDFRF